VSTCNHILKPGHMPVIGILGTRIASSPDSPFTHVERDGTNSAYIGAIERAGGVPIMLPVVEHLCEATVANQLAVCHGILIPGGVDVDPALYGEKPLPLLQTTSRHTDDYDLLAIRLATVANIPMLGICRGIQVLNVARGGSLWQDVSLSPVPATASRVDHRHYACYQQGCHEVTVIEGSALSRLFPGHQRLSVNSLHHQAIHTLGKDLSISAIADDGIVEAIEGRTRQWVLGVQWHPEVMVSGKEYLMAAIFKAFVQVAASN